MNERWRTRLHTALDVVVPLAVTLFLFAVILGQNKEHPSDFLRLVGPPVVLAQGVALVWRRSRPVEVTALAVAGGLGMQLIAPDGIIPVAGLVAVGALAAHRPPPVSLSGLLALLGVAATNFRTATAGDTYFAMALAVAAWALGEVARNRGVAIEQESRRAVVEERARIAREMHDVVAHSVSVIVVQAAAADDVFDVRPDQARQALESIEATGREALVELRRLLAPVRPGGDGVGAGGCDECADDGSAAGVGAGVGAGVEPPLPQPDLGRVEELAGPVRAAGLDVSIGRVGQPRALAAGIDVSAYRIVQEAVTNTLRHARASRVEVTITYGAETVEVDVVDDGSGTAADDFDNPVARFGGGHGIIGMRERAGMLGGTLEAGPLPSGGFRVRARLPAPPVRETVGDRAGEVVGKAASDARID